jgi:Fe2+ or Zn2+ uptake regulation protein
MSAPTTRDRIISALTLANSPCLGFTQIAVLVAFQRPTKPMMRRTVRRALDKLVAEGRVVEDKAPGLAAYSLVERTPTQKGAR